MLKFRDITHDLDLVNRCLDGAQAIDGLRYNTEVAVKQGQVHAAFMGDEIVGGYVLVTKGPFRVLKQVDIFRRDDYTKSIDTSEIVEVGAVWLSPTVTDKRGSIRFWLNMLKSIIKTRRKFIIYGVNLDRVGLVKLYAGMNPDVMWQGETAGFGMTTHPRLALQKVPVSRFLRYTITGAVTRIISKRSVRGITLIIQKKTKVS